MVQGGQWSGLEGQGQIRQNGESTGTARNGEALNWGTAGPDEVGSAPVRSGVVGCGSQGHGTLTMGEAMFGQVWRD